MSEHVVDLMDIYLDGEAGSSDALRIEAHLKSCQTCAQAFAQHRRLSQLIKSQPVPLARKTEREFTAEVMARIGGQPEQKRKETAAADLGWIGIPLLLVFGLIFIQTVWVESNLMQFIPQVDQTLTLGQFFLPFSFALPAFAGEIVRFISELNLLSWNWASGVLITIALSFLYVSWLAGWWVRNQKRTSM